VNEETDRPTGAAGPTAGAPATPDTTSAAAPDELSPSDAGIPSTLPDAASLAPEPDDDTPIEPDPLVDAPDYAPSVYGMTGGGVPRQSDADDAAHNAWITSAPAPAQRSVGRAGIVSAIVGVVIVVGVLAYFLAGQIGLIGNKGKILFGTAAGPNLCTVGNPTTTVRTGDPLFIAAIMKDRIQGDEAFTFEVWKDGQQYLVTPVNGNGQAFDCYGNTEDLGLLDPGAYVFEVLKGTDVEARGELTVTP
jgi:hypothetical protein